MSNFQKIKKSIKNIAKEVSAGHLVFIGEVKKTNGEKCDLLVDGSLEVTDCRLRAVFNENEQQVLITPKVGSYVLGIDLSEGQMRDVAVIAYSEVEKINVKTGEKTIVIDNNGIVINGGNLGGMVKIQELTNKINELVTKFNTHTHSGTSTPSGNAFTTLVPSVNQNPFNKSDYEDQTIKH